MPTPAENFFETTPLKTILNLSGEALDQVMATAYVLYQVGRYTEVEVLCKGLVAADHQYWWSYSLYAAALREMGRLPEALQQIELGLRWEPGQPKLLEMRSELLDRMRVAAQPSTALPAAAPVAMATSQRQGPARSTIRPGS